MGELEFRKAGTLRIDRASLRTAMEPDEIR